MHYCLASTVACLLLPGTSFLLLYHIQGKLQLTTIMLCNRQGAGNPEKRDLGPGLPVIDDVNKPPAVSTAEEQAAYCASEASMACACRRHHEAQMLVQHC